MSCASDPSRIEHTTSKAIEDAKQKKDAKKEAKGQKKAANAAAAAAAAADAKKGDDGKAPKDAKDAGKKGAAAADDAGGGETMMGWIITSVTVVLVLRSFGDISLVSPGLVRPVHVETAGN